MSMAAATTGGSAAADEAIAVEVDRISKIYPGGVEALNDISLASPKGRLTTLLGSSGCGKTTLLKVIAGLIEATRGEVRIGGRPVIGVPGQSAPSSFRTSR